MGNNPAHYELITSARGKRGRPGHREPVTKLGQRLRELRSGHGLTQTQLATKLGFGQNRVCDHENGFHLPQLSALKCYADLFGITVAELLDGVM